MQPGFWDIAPYVYDILSLGSIISTGVSTVASLCNASGLGWLAPLIIPLVGAFVQNVLAIHSEEVLGDQTLKQKYLGAVSTLLSGATGMVGIMVASGAVSAAAATTAIVTIIMGLLEFLRVRMIDRETIWGLVARCCRRGENAPLLQN